MIAVQAYKDAIDKNNVSVSEIDNELRKVVYSIVNEGNSEEIKRVETPITRKYARAELMKKISKDIKSFSILALHVGGLVLAGVISRMASPN